MRPFYYAAVSLLLAVGCAKDQAVRLFEMRYINHEFAVPAGHSPISGAMVYQKIIPSFYEENRTANDVAEGEVASIRPYFATMTSISGLDFSYLSSISIRVCESSAAACTEFDEVFFLGDLYRRRLTQLRLDPGLQTKTSLLQQDGFKLEVVLFPAEVTPYAMDFQLDFAFEAVK